MSDNVRRLPSLTRASEADRLTLALALHPAGKRQAGIPIADAELFERQADDYRELAQTFRPGSRLGDYYRAVASGFDDLANTAHIHADLIEQWGVTADDAARAAWWAQDTRFKEAINAAREAGDTALVETLKQERSEWLQHQLVTRTDDKGHVSAETVIITAITCASVLFLATCALVGLG